MTTASTETIETPVTSAWRAPGFRRLATAWVFTNLGDSALYLMVAVWVKELTGSDVAAAFVFVSLGIPAVLAPFLGMLADRVSRKRLLVVANALLVPIVLSLALMNSPERVWIAYGVILLYSSCGYLTAAAQSGLVRGMLSDDQLASANGTLSTIDNGLRLIAPLIGTGLYVWLGPLPVVALTAVCFAVTAAILTGLPRDVAPERTAHRGHLRELVAGFEHIARIAPLRWVTVSIAIAFGATGLLNVVVFAVLDGMNASPATIGWLMPLQGAGALAGGILSARIVRGLGEGRAAALGMLLLAAGTVPLVTGSVALAAAGMIVMGFGIPIAVVAFVTLRQRMTPDELQGRTSAAGNVAINLPQTIVSIIGAALLVAVDYRVLIWITIAVVLVGAAVALAVKTRPAVRPVEES